MYIYILYFFRKELPKSCNYHVISVRQKPVGALDVMFFPLCWFWGGGAGVGSEVRSAWTFLGTAILFEPLTASLVDLDQ